MTQPRDFHKMDTKELCVAAAVASVARIDATITEKLRKRAHKHGLTDREANALVEAWKRAAAQDPPNSGNSVGL